MDDVQHEPAGSTPGRFGAFGGRYVPEALVPALEELDEDLGVTVADLTHSAGIAERFAERDTRELAERAAADRPSIAGRAAEQSR